MSTLPATRLTVLIVAGLALLFAQWAGAHLHLCLDGTEPPMSVHVAGGEDHRAGHGQEHEDLDLTLPGAALLKAAKLLPELPPLLVLCVVLLLAWSAPRPAPVIRAAAPCPSPSCHLRPPLRGPPPFSR